MNYKKIFSKFRYYWLTDDNFRESIYYSFEYAPSNLIFDYEQQEFLHAGYDDFFSLFPVYYCGISGPIWTFLVGLLFPNRVLKNSGFPVRNEAKNKTGKHDDFYLFGKSLSLEGNLFCLWSNIDNLGRNGVYFVRGSDESLPPAAFDEINTWEPKYQSQYLLGRDSLLNSSSIRFFLKNKKGNL